MAKYYKGARKQQKAEGEKFSLDQMITDKIIEQLQQGIIPWCKDWQGRPPISYIARRAYHGTNMLTLPEGGEYITGAQAKAQGCKIKEGVHGFKIIYWEIKKYEKNGEETTRPFIKWTTVFPLHMIEDIESKYPEGYTVPAESPEEIINKYSNVCKVDTADYPAAFRQLVEHAFLSNMSNNADVTILDMVKEIGAGFLLSKCGLSDTSIEDTAAYCESWIPVVQQNPKLIMRAAGQAQKVVDSIMGISS